MSGDAFRDKLIPYLDGELCEADTAELERHLKRCLQCRKELEAIRAVLSLTSIDAPPEFAEVEWKTHPVKRIPWWRWAWVPASAAAVLAILIFGGDAIFDSKGTVQKEGWVVVGEDSLSSDEGMALASLLIAQDEDIIEGLVQYNEVSSRDIYSEIYDLSENEKSALENLLEEMTQESEGVEI